MGRKAKAEGMGEDVEGGIWSTQKFCLGPLKALVQPCLQYSFAEWNELKVCETETHRLLRQTDTGTHTGTMSITTLLLTWLSSLANVSRPLLLHLLGLQSQHVRQITTIKHLRNAP